MIIRKPSIPLLAFFSMYMVVGMNAQGTQDTNDRGSKAVMLERRDGTIIEASVKARLAPASSAAVMIYQIDGKNSKRIVNESSVADCGNDFPVGKVCKSSPSPGLLTFDYTLAQPPDPETKFEIAYFITDADHGDVGEMMKITPVVDAKSTSIDDFAASEKPDFNTDIERNPNGEIRVKISFPEERRSTPAIREYVRQRVDALYQWLELQLNNPETVAKVRIEPRTKRDVYDYSIEAMRLEPTGQRQALMEGEFDIILVTDRNFPTGKFDMEVKFSGTPPPELQGWLLSSDNVPAMKTADARNAGNDRSYDLRDLKNNLDLGLSYTSSVETLKVGNRSVRNRKNNATVDLQLAPLLDWHRDGDFKNYFTPFFIDAKVSNGAIANKTLSLNRIIFGTEYSLREVTLSGKEKNKFIYTFRGLSASDRDFKRAEAKFNFEFRPLFWPLYSPLNAVVEHVPSELFKNKKEDKEVPKHNYGYQIQPFIGFDIGSLYRNSRTAFDAEDPGRFVRRLYFGTDMTFNLTRYMNVVVNDKFYIRGENVRNRTRNYFRGELQAVLTNNGDTSQCIFFSFERGDQPPFSTPSVNALKIGYRLTSNLFQRRP